MAAGALCEFAWRALRLRSEPPVTRFSVEQLATAHWFDTRAAARDFGYVPRSHCRRPATPVESEGRNPGSIRRRITPNSDFAPTVTGNLFHRRLLSRRTQYSTAVVQQFQVCAGGVLVASVVFVLDRR
jgi:hypothetical protein